MVRPTSQSVLSISTIALFVAAIVIWLVNGGLGRIRQATGSHSGGAGAYTETWTSDSVFGLAKCSDTNSSGGRSASGSNVFLSAEFPRVASTTNYAQNPPEFSFPALASYGIEGAKLQDTRSWNCYVDNRSDANSPTVTKWTVTGHISP